MKIRHPMLRAVAAILLALPVGGPPANAVAAQVGGDASSKTELTRAVSRPDSLDEPEAGPERVGVLQLQTRQPQPATPEQARAAIERVLLGEKRKALPETEIGKLRGNGTIEYASGLATAAPGMQAAES